MTHLGLRLGLQCGSLPALPAAFLLQGALTVVPSAGRSFLFGAAPETHSWVLDCVAVAALSCSHVMEVGAPGGDRRPRSLWSLMSTAGNMGAGNSGHRLESFGRFASDLIMFLEAGGNSSTLGHSRQPLPVRSSAWIT